MPTNPTVSAFQRRTDAIKQRKGMIVLSEASAYLAARARIIAVDDSAGTIQVSRDVSSDLSTGDIFVISGNEDLGIYGTVSAVTTDTITLAEGVPATTVAEGYVVTPYPIYNLGILQNAEFTTEERRTTEDTTGQSYVTGADYNMSFAMMQTGRQELRNIQALTAPGGSGLYVAVLDSPAVVQDTVAGFQHSDISQIERLEFLNTAVGVVPVLNFANGESLLNCSITGSATVAELGKLYLEPIIAG